MEVLKERSSVIHKALRTCNIEEVKKALILDKDNINLKDDRLGWVPIYKAVLYGDEEIVRLLLSNGADPNIQNNVKFNLKLFNINIYILFYIIKNELINN